MRRCTFLFLLLILMTLPAAAAIFYPVPYAITVGAGAVTVDIQRLPGPGEPANFGPVETDTFVWFAPGAYPFGTPLRLQPATFVRPDTVRVQLPAEALTVPGIGYIVYTLDQSQSSEREAIAVFVNRPAHIEGVLSGGTVNTRMSQTLEAVDGTGPFQWSIPAGSLPPGVALVGRAQSADFVGIPTTAGSYTFTLRVVDGFKIPAEKQYTIVMAPPPGPALRISTTTLPSGAVGSAYQAQLQATGGAPPYQWSSTGGLPPGLSLLPAGLLSGAPTTVGSYEVAVRVVDTAGSVDQKTISLRIDPTATLTSFNAASYESGVAAPESVVSGFTTLPSTNVTVTVRETAARVLFATSSQINYLVPAGLTSGAAEVTVRTPGQTVATGTLVIQPVAPGIFTASSDGKGVAAGAFLRVAADGSQTPGQLFGCDSTGCRPETLDLGGATDSVYLVLYGTGIRGRGSLSAVTATVGGESVPVRFAGAQAEYPGVDQVNLGPLPRTLAGRGPVTLQLRVDGRDANPVTIAIR